MGYVDAVFGSDGMLARTLTGYSPRKGQIRLAAGVDKAFGSNRHLLAEAPTGTGKSISYLVPAIYHTSPDHGQHRRVVVATANIALQEQLTKKDLPFLKRALPIPFEFALVKGRSNFACVDRVDRADQAKTQFDPDEVRAFDRIVAWAKETSTGDVSELPEVPSPKLWSELSCTSEQCKGRKCPRRNDCFVAKAREEADGAQVIVANYHLLFADMQVRANSESIAGVLPVYDLAVLDEAHQAADIARSFLGSKVSFFSIRRLVHDGLRIFRDAKKAPSDSMVGVMSKLEDEASQFFESILLYRRSKSYKVRLRKVAEIDASSVVMALGKFANRCSNMSDSDALEGANRESFRKLANRAKEHAGLLERAVLLEETENHVHYIEESGGNKPYASVCSSPIDVAEELNKGLFEHADSVVAMSATMVVGRSGFDHIASDLGVDTFDSLVVESPFDMHRQAAFVSPVLSQPNDPAFRTEVTETISEVVNRAKGRTLGLFTSYATLRQAAERLRRDGTANKYKVLVQGEGPRTKLIEEFRSDVSSVLLGTESFWEGVDVQGEALSCVVIDRLPFSNPDDPIVDVISERDPRWFMKWCLPRSLIAFRQGIGRLIRTTTDRGVIVLLDRRVFEKPYGKQFLSFLGGMRMSRRLEDISSFLEVNDVES